MVCVRPAPAKAPPDLSHIILILLEPRNTPHPLERSFVSVAWEVTNHISLNVNENWRTEGFYWHVIFLELSISNSICNPSAMKFDSTANQEQGTPQALYSASKKPSASFGTTPNEPPIFVSATP